MVQAADFGQLHDPPDPGRLDGPEVGCVFVEREVGARLLIVGEVAGQDAAEVSPAEDEYVRTSSIRMPFTRCRNCSP
jgi:hypothetical protein